MLKAFVEKIEDLANLTCTTNEGRVLTSRIMYPIEQPTPDTLEIHTLDGIVEYLDAMKDNTDSPRTFIHIEDYSTVHLCTDLYGTEKQRDIFVTAKAYKVSHRFGAYMPQNEFITYLQSCFVQDEIVTAILRAVGNIVQGAEQEFSDDGITQRAVARAGIARREFVEIPNPVLLRPYRTFPDLEQPASRFVLRLVPGEDGRPPQCTLHEADGGAWRSQAIDLIKEYFANYDVPVIG